MVTKQDVAKRAGVSTATVGRVLSGKGYVSAESRAKVEEAIKALNYRRNNLAANLRKRKSNVIAVLVEDLLNPYYMHLAEAMGRRAKEKNSIVSLHAVSDRDVRQVLDDLFSNRVCGIVNLACSPAISRGTTPSSKRASASSTARRRARRSLSTMQRGCTRRWRACSGRAERAPRLLRASSRGSHPETCA